MAQDGKKWVKYDFEHSGGPKWLERWEQSWNELQEVQVKVLDPLESGEGGWCAPNFVPGAPKDGQKGPNLAKI